MTPCSQVVLGIGNFTKTLREKQNRKTHVIIIFEVKIEIKRNFYYEI